MPNYPYVCLNCDIDEERNVPIKDRDKQTCGVCGSHLNRTYQFNGVVWSPTSTGGGHK